MQAKWTASALFRMMEDAYMLAPPRRVLPRDAPIRLCLQLISECCTKLQKGVDWFLLSISDFLQQRARKGHGKVFSHMYARPLSLSLHKL